MDLEIIAEIIEKSLKHIKNLDIDNRVISWTIKRVDKFIELKVPWHLKYEREHIDIRI